MEYHDIFSLDKNKIGCRDAAEHVIKLLDEEPLKEKFWQIALPLLDEVREHLQEMLDGRAIWPSQSTWCYVVVLVWKKDGRSQNTVPIASTQVAIKGTVQYSMRESERASELESRQSVSQRTEQLATRHSREHTLSAVGPESPVE